MIIKVDISDEEATAIYVAARFIHEHTNLGATLLRAADKISDAIDYAKDEESAIREEWNEKPGWS